MAKIEDQILGALLVIGVIAFILAVSLKTGPKQYQEIIHLVLVFVSGLMICYPLVEIVFLRRGHSLSGWTLLLSAAALLWVLGGGRTTGASHEARKRNGKLLIASGAVGVALPMFWYWFLK